jgi:tripartite-type tricarboxylate transporter receptor subunit TctC
MRRRRIFGLLAAAMPGMTAAQATDREAADYPVRPVTIMVPYTAGGPSDVAARILAEELQKVWNQRVLIDNRPGGGTIIGTTAVPGRRPTATPWPSPAVPLS